MTSPASSILSSFSTTYPGAGHTEGKWKNGDKKLFSTVMSHYDSESQCCTHNIISAHIWEILDSFAIIYYHNAFIMVL